MKRMRKGRHRKGIGKEESVEILDGDKEGTGQEMRLVGRERGRRMRRKVLKELKETKEGHMETV